MQTAIIEVVNAKGLHARAAAKFVKVVSGYGVSLRVTKLAQPGEEQQPAVGGTSILGLMMLGADRGSTLQLEAEGDYEVEVLEALAALMANKFGEGS